jgi:hypothetical protein
VGDEKVLAWRPGGPSAPPAPVRHQTGACHAHSGLGPGRGRGGGAHGCLAKRVVGGHFSVLRTNLGDLVEEGRHSPPPLHATEPVLWVRSAQSRGGGVRPRACAWPLRDPPRARATTAHTGRPFEGLLLVRRAAREAHPQSRHARGCRKGAPQGGWCGEGGHERVSRRDFEVSRGGRRPWPTPVVKCVCLWRVQHPPPLSRPLTPCSPPRSSP